jgi:hypothetical protein
MAKAYGLLPSQVRDNATTYDIKVTETLVAWENKLHTEASTGRPVAPKLTQEQLMAMMAKVKKDKEEQNERIKQQHLVEVEPNTKEHGT